jgi:hypothetical protein
VAIKQLRADIYSSVLQEKFTKEAKISFKFGTHPNVVTTFGIWGQQGSVDSMIVMGSYFVMGSYSSRVHGHRLKKVL